MRSAGSFFFPLDHKLALGTEGYSPRVLEKAVRQASKAASFEDASADLRELAGVSISASHLQRLSQRLGQEWAQVRDQEVQAFRDKRLLCVYAAGPQAAAVMLDGGRVQTRAAGRGPGVQQPAWSAANSAWDGRRSSVSSAGVSTETGLIFLGSIGSYYTFFDGRTPRSVEARGK